MCIYFRKEVAVLGQARCSVSLRTNPAAALCGFIFLQQRGKEILHVVERMKHSTARSLIKSITKHTVHMPVRGLRQGSVRRGEPQPWWAHSHGGSTRGHFNGHPYTLAFIGSVFIARSLPQLSKKCLGMFGLTLAMLFTGTKICGHSAPEDFIWKYLEIINDSSNSASF